MKDMSDLWTGIGIMCVLIGVGGCNYLIDNGEAEKIKARKEIKIENPFNTSTNKS